jgi:hypothetical protein
VGSSEGRLLSQLRERINAIDTRLSGIEQRVGAGPGLSDLEEQIVRLRSERLAAADAQEYEKAASLRDREKELLAEKASRQQQWATAHPDLPSLAEKYSQLSEELGSLRALIGQHGVEPDDKTA